MNAYDQLSTLLRYSVGPTILHYRPAGQDGDYRVERNITPLSSEDIVPDSVVYIASDKETIFSNNSLPCIV